MAIDVIDKLIDAHVHVWSANTPEHPFAPGFTSDNPWLERFTPADHAQISEPFGKVRLNLIQITWYELDHSYILDLIASDPSRFVGTGIIPAYSDVSFAPPDRTMIGLAQRGCYAFRVRGGFGRPDWLDHEGHRKMFQAGADHNLALSFLMPPSDLLALDAMCERYPDTPVILDHFCGVGANENIEEKKFVELCNMARHRRVMVKVGPFHSRGKRQRPYLDLLPLIQRVADAFGPDRLMWETDSGGPTIPDDPAASFKASVELIRDHADFLSDSDKAQILYKTAEDFFFNR